MRELCLVLDGLGQLCLVDAVIDVFWLILAVSVGADYLVHGSPFFRLRRTSAVTQWYACMRIQEPLAMVSYLTCGMLGLWQEIRSSDSS